MFKQLLFILSALCGIFSAFAAEPGPLKIIDLVPEGCAPVWQKTLQLSMQGKIRSADIRRTPAPAEKAVAELKSGKADFILIASDQVPGNFKGGILPFMREVAALYVNAVNPLKGVSMEQARSLLRDPRPVWQPLNGSPADIQRIGLKPERRAERETVIRLLGLKYADTAEEIFRVLTTPEIVLLVSGNQQAVGFGRLLPDFPVSVKTLEIDGAAPTLENLYSGKYPLQKLYVILYLENKSAEAGIFLQELNTAAFADLIADNGFFPAQ